MATNNTSGTYNFNLEIGDVIQEATEMIGGEVTLGEEPRSARRSINVILNESNFIIEGDINQDQTIDVIDVVLLVNIILAG